MAMDGSVIRFIHLESVFAGGIDVAYRLKKVEKRKPFLINIMSNCYFYDGNYI
jgi:hypothetical protein